MHHNFKVIQPDTKAHCTDSVKEVQNTSELRSLITLIIVSKKFIAASLLLHKLVFLEIRKTSLRLSDPRGVLYVHFDCEICHYN